LELVQGTTWTATMIGGDVGTPMSVFIRHNGATGIANGNPLSLSYYRDYLRNYV